MPILHTCGEMAYKLSYQVRKVDEIKPKYFKTNRFYCRKCDKVVKITEEDDEN